MSPRTKTFSSSFRIKTEPSQPQGLTQNPLKVQVVEDLFESRFARYKPPTPTKKNKNRFNKAIRKAREQTGGPPTANKFGAMIDNIKGFGKSPTMKIARSP